MAHVVDYLKLLRDHGADPWHLNSPGQTPIGLARLIANDDVASSSLTSPTPTRKCNPQVLTIAPDPLDGRRSLWADGDDVCRSGTWAAFMLRMSLVGMSRTDVFLGRWSVQTRASVFPERCLVIC
jgi:hypothetical protein